LFAPADEPIFNQVALIAPDIDAAIFKRDLVPALIPRVERITLYASSQDMALAASNKVHGGYPRAGESGDGLVIIEGIDTIDASNLNTDFLGHSYFAQSTPVIDDLFKLLRTGNSPELRRLIQRRKNGMAYWALPG
jgi:esterase/lipase superfamily enzyme